MISLKSRKPSNLEWFLPSPWWKKPWPGADRNSYSDGWTGLPLPTQVLDMDYKSVEPTFVEDKQTLATFSSIVKSGYQNQIGHSRCHARCQVFNQLYLESFKRLKSSQVTLSRCVLATIKDRFKKLNGCWLWFCYEHFLWNHICFEIHRMDVSQNYSPFEESEGRAACQMHK